MLQTAPCWVEISHDGRFLFTVNTGSGNISRYSIARWRRADAAGQHAGRRERWRRRCRRPAEPRRPVPVRRRERIGAVGAFAVNGGNLTELSSSPTSLPAGADARRHRRQLDRFTVKPEPGASRPRLRPSATKVAQIPQRRPARVYLQVDVPSGVRQIDVSYSYDKPTQPAGTVSHFLDIGIFDEHGIAVRGKGLHG